MQLIFMFDFTISICYNTGNYRSLWNYFMELSLAEKLGWYNLVSSGQLNTLISEDEINAANALYYRFGKQNIINITTKLGGKLLLCRGYGDVTSEYYKKPTCVYLLPDNSALEIIQTSPGSYFCVSYFNGSFDADEDPEEYCDSA